MSNHQDEHNFGIFKSELNKVGLLYQIIEHNSGTPGYYEEHLIVKPEKGKLFWLIPFTNKVPIAKIDNYKLVLAEKSLGIEIIDMRYSGLIKQVIEDFKRKRLQTETIETKL